MLINMLIDGFIIEYIMRNCLSVDIKSDSERIDSYKKLLQRLPPVNHATLKFIIGHLVQ